MDIEKRVVNVESPLLVKLVKPLYFLMSELDIYTQRPFIYVGSLGRGVLSKIRGLDVPFVVAAHSGGEVTLVREDFFHVCSKRKRKYDSYLDKLPIDDFINLMWIMKLTGKLEIDTESNFLFELFDLISRKSKDAVNKAAILLNTKSPVYLTTSLLTFIGRVMSYSDIESGVVSGGYRLVLQRSFKRRKAFERALRVAARMDYSGDSFRFLSMVRELIDD